MSYQPRFRFEQRDETGGVIYDDAVAIAEIRELKLYNVALFPLLHRRASSPLDPSSRRTPGSKQKTLDAATGPQSAIVIGPTYPLPLYWHQYANHQHPERNAGSHGILECVRNTESKISLEIESASRSRQVISRYALDLTYSDERGSYVFDIRCSLEVPDGNRWLVTHNPSHGELEFCNLWPEGTFVSGEEQPSSKHSPSSPRRRGSIARKRFDGCFVQRGGTVERIPHHHLETSDKHNIGMDAGDRFMWLLEDENPVVEICSPDPVAAGLCAYMWDAHFAYRVCKDGKDVHLPSGSSYEARFKLYAIGREEGERTVEVAKPRPAPEIESIPIYVDGLNTFDPPVIPAQAGIHFADSPEGYRDGKEDNSPDPIRSVQPERVMDPRLRGDDERRGNDVGVAHRVATHHIWPWEHDPTIPGVIEYALDREEGHNDDASVRIQAFRPTTGRWKATTLGPAFGEPPFENGKRYRLSAYVKSRDLVGRARVGLRLHRTGIGDVFDIASYETYYSGDSMTEAADWRVIEVMTPVIEPAPDRMHLLLEMDGEGTCWFDDVLFERNV